MSNIQHHTAAFGMWEGELSAWKTFSDKPREKIFSEINLITRPAKLYLLSSLWDGAVVADPVVSFKVGTGGAIDPQGLFPKPEDPEQLNLITPLLSVTTSYLVNEAEVKVTYLADLDQSEGNGSLITEAGLFKQSGLIFNVKNFPGIPKTSEFGLHFEWSVKAV